MIKAKRAVVKFDESGLITVDGYLLPSGELRAGMVGTSLANGFSRGWLSQVHSRQGSTLKTLIRKGFEASSQLDVLVEHDNGSGSSIATTISLKSFLAVTTYGVAQDKDKAVAIFQGLATAPLENRFREALGVDLISARESLEIASTITERVYEEL